MKSDFASVTLYLLLVLLYFCGSGVDGLSPEEDLELEEEFARLNKPAVKTIKVSSIYDVLFLSRSILVGVRT